MKRHWVLALATLVAIPRLASAQSDSGWGPILRVTPFAGVSPGIKQKGTAFVETSSGVVAHPYDLNFSSSVPLGLILEARVWNRFGIAVGGQYSSRGEVEIVDFETETFPTPKFDGVDLWSAKANVTMRLRERESEMQLKNLGASLFIGPAVIHDKPKNTSFTPFSGDETINHWALNFGAEADMPLSNRALSFTVGLEDYMIFWDNDNYASRIDAYVNSYQPLTVTSVIDTEKTHMWVLRFGLTWKH